MDEWYTILGITPGVVPEEIKRAWRKKCLEHHPDKGGDQRAFMRVMHAYRMITDPSYQAQQKPMRSLNFEVQVPISFEEGFFGTTVLINYNRLHLDLKGDPIKTDPVEPIYLKVEVPPGSCGGYRKVEPGMGMKMGESTGDASVHVITNPHHRYHVNGVDVITSEGIPLDVMLRGGNIEVITLYGLKTAWVPPGTPPGGRIVIPKCGVAKMGHHVVIAEPLFPSLDDLKSETWSKMDIQWAQQVRQVDEELIELHEVMRRDKGSPQG